MRCIGFAFGLWRLRRSLRVGAWGRLGGRSLHFRGARAFEWYPGTGVPRPYGSALPFSAYAAKLYNVCDRVGYNRCDSRAAMSAAGSRSGRLSNEAGFLL
eukprot:6015464-Prymnesium_polylepis.1